MSANTGEHVKTYETKSRGVVHALLAVAGFVTLFAAEFVIMS
jgi:hypothetical protein